MIQALAVLIGIAAMAAHPAGAGHLITAAFVFAAFCAACATVMVVARARADRPRVVLAYANAPAIAQTAWKGL
jgi:hypothetical protein